MIEFTTHIDIDRPREEVFDFVADFENTPAWNYFVIDVTKRSAGPPGVGSVFRQVRKTDQQDYEIIALEPGRSIEIQTTPGSSPAFRIRYEFETVDGGTRLTDRWHLETGYTSMFERLGARSIRRAVTENLHKLKELLETGTAQDGRISTFS